VNADILTEDELTLLSGAGTRPTMIRWLMDNRVPYLLARSGWPRVHRKALEEVMGVGKTKQAAGQPVQFNFGAIK
jgi:hypothetical protein